MRDHHLETIVDEVAKKLTTARKAKGLSHEKLAQKAGITRPAISYIENGHRRPSLMIALKIAHALDLKLWQVLKKLEK